MRKVSMLLALFLPLAACQSGAEPFTLTTHCGIDNLQYEGRWYERVGGPLDDGSGNPPTDWDNPEQEGSIEDVDASTLVFTDASGHHEEFELRDGATGPKTPCD